MTLAGGVSYGYDNNGNQTSRGSDSFTWDHENRLTSANIGGASSSYVYNSDGLRTSRTRGAVTTNYIWDVNRGVPVILQDDDYTYVYGLGLISMTDSSGNQTYRMTDGLGSTVGLCDGSGTALDTYVYDAFGIIQSSTGTSDNYFLYAGEQRDPESGLDYLRARYYDSTVGRFLGRDVAAPDWRMPVSINLFSYGNNNPLMLVDPLGTSEFEVGQCYVDAGGGNWFPCGEIPDDCCGVPNPPCLWPCGSDLTDAIEDAVTESADEAVSCAAWAAAGAVVGGEPGAAIGCAAGVVGNVVNDQVDQPILNAALSCADWAVAGFVVSGGSAAGAAVGCFQGGGSSVAQSVGPSRPSADECAFWLDQLYNFGACVIDVVTQ
jgi:RHS repeat-associated protein